MITVVRKYKLLSLAFILLALNAALFFVLPHYRFSSIVIHHSASEVDNYQSIKAYHRKSHGWRDAAYHLILSNGSTQVPLGHLEATGRYHFLAYSLATQSPVHNMTGVHICVVGNYSRHAMPGRLRPALAHAITALQERYHIPDSKILFHRDCSQSECPGTKLHKAEVLKWTKTLAQTCPPAIRDQHEAVLAAAYFSPYTAPLWFMAVLLLANGLVALAWIGGLAVLRRRARSRGQKLHEIDGDILWALRKANLGKEEPASRMQT